MTTKPAILIVGGGLGGLVLAQVLRKHQIPFRIFDRDANATSRRQGWALSLHWVINEMLSTMPDDLPPWETVSHLHNIGLTASAAFYNGITGERYGLLGPQEGKPFVRADREKLRQWLSTNVNVEWNKRFDRYEENEHGVTVYFADGTSATGDVLVGADGGSSNVRKQLLGAERARNNILPIEVCMGETTLTKAQYEPLFRDLGRSFYIAEESILLFTGTYRVAQDRETAEYYWMTCRRKESTADDNNSHNDDRRTDLKTNLEYYHRAIQAVQGMRSEFLLPLYNTTLDGIVNPPISLEDYVPPDEGLPRGRVTLLGDALHLMTPFRGSGGNFAMKDSLLLGSLLVNDKNDDIAMVLKQYESLALPKAVEAALDSRARTMKWTNHTHDGVEN